MLETMRRSIVELRDHGKFGKFGPIRSSQPEIVPLIEGGNAKHQSQDNFSPDQARRYQASSQSSTSCRRVAFETNRRVVECPRIRINAASSPELAQRITSSSDRTGTYLSFLISHIDSFRPTH